jgi:hypothetical protein
MPRNNNMKLRNVCLVLAVLCSTDAAADEAILAVGPGVHVSDSSTAYFLQYYRDAKRLWGFDSFFELSLGHWPGDAAATIAAASGGLRWNFENRSYARVSLGAGYLNHTTERLGTHGQFMEQIVIGREFGAYDLGAGMIHISNGDSILHTGEPNGGENFFTVRLGYRF